MRLLQTASVHVMADGHRRTTIQIGDFPRVGEPVKDRNGADVYKVPDGVSVLTYDITTGKVSYEAVTNLTVEQNANCVKVTTAHNRSVEVSDNESLAVFDQETGQLSKMKPVDAIGKLVPFLKRNEFFGTEFSFDAGWWYGALIADGWISDERTVG